MKKLSLLALVAVITFAPGCGKKCDDGTKSCCSVSHAATERKSGDFEAQDADFVDSANEDLK